MYIRTHAAEKFSLLGYFVNLSYHLFFESRIKIIIILTFCTLPSLLNFTVVWSHLLWVFSLFIICAVWANKYQCNYHYQWWYTEHWYCTANQSGNSVSFLLIFILVNTCIRTSFSIRTYFNMILSWNTHCTFFIILLWTTSTPSEYFKYWIRIFWDPRILIDMTIGSDHQTWLYQHLYFNVYSNTA